MALKKYNEANRVELNATVQKESASCSASTQAQPGPTERTIRLEQRARREVARPGLESGPVVASRPATVQMAAEGQGGTSDPVDKVTAPKKKKWLCYFVFIIIFPSL